MSDILPSFCAETKWSSLFSFCSDLGSQTLVPFGVFRGRRRGCWSCCRGWLCQDKVQSPLSWHIHRGVKFLWSHHSHPLFAFLLSNGFFPFSTSWPFSAESRLIKLHSLYIICNSKYRVKTCDSSMNHGNCPAQLTFM